MRGRLYLTCFLLMSVGALVGRSPVVPFAASVFTLLAIAAARKKARGTARVLIALPLFFTLGAFLMSTAVAGAGSGILPALAREKRTAEVSGKADTYPRYSGGDYASFFMSVDSVRTNHRSWKTRETLLVLVESGAGRLPYRGQRVGVRGSLRRPAGETDWLLSHGGTMAVIHASGGVELKDGGGFLDRVLDGSRRWLVTSIKRVFNRDAAGFMTGVTLSERRRVDERLLADLEGSGTAHLVAVSGLHVAAAAAAVLALLKLTGAGRRTRYAAAGATALLVMGIAGFRPSATRAATMASIGFSGAIIGRRYDPLAGLSVAGIALLVSDPLAVVDPGFQLSFAAAAAIIVTAAGPGRPGGIKGLVRASAAAQLGIIPVLILRKDAVPLGAIAANLVAVPLLGPLMVTGLLAALLSWLSVGAGRLAALPAEVFLRIITVAASYFAKFPSAATGQGAVGVAALLAYVLGLVGLIRSGPSYRRMFRWLAPLLLSLLFASIIYLPVPFVRSTDRVTFFDVGQGDAILVEDHSGGRLLIDGGPAGSGVVRKLRERGVNRLDMVVLTHPHADHLGGLLEVMSDIPVGRILEPGLPGGTSALYRRFLDFLSSRGIPRTTAREGQVVEVSKATRLEVLYSPSSLRDFPEGLNDCSVVAMLELDGANFLLTGDVESTGQEILLEGHPDLSCDVLKVPHQGAADSTSGDLLSSCDPDVAVISVGRGNSYGHPSPRCLEVLREYDTRVLRTDLCGDVEISVEDGRIGVRTSKGQGVGPRSGGRR